MRREGGYFSGGGRLQPAFQHAGEGGGYFTEDEVVEELYHVIQNIDANREFLRGIDRKMLIGNVFAMLVAAVVCLKHEGFHEEREWRAIHSPKRSPSPHIESSVEVVGGVPQLIYKVPLENNASASIRGMEISELLDRVIIGPTQFPWVTYEAFVTSLEVAGVKDAASRVFISRIPVRTIVKRYLASVGLSAAKHTVFDRVAIDCVAWARRSAPCPLYAC